MYLTQDNATQQFDITPRTLSTYLNSGTARTYAENYIVQLHAQ